MIDVCFNHKEICYQRQPAMEHHNVLPEGRVFPCLQTATALVKNFTGYKVLHRHEICLYLSQEDQGPFASYDKTEKQYTINAINFQILVIDEG